MRAQATTPKRPTKQAHKTMSMPDSAKRSSQTVSLAELLGSLSYALDITQGQPAGHCIRVCWIGTHIGRELGLPDEQLWELYYTLILKDLGCSSNAARIHQFYLTDDRTFKKEIKKVPPSVSGLMSFVLDHVGQNKNLVSRLRAIGNVMRSGKAVATELVQTRCHRGASIARQLRFSNSVAQGIFSLDEHWDGSGHPQGLSGRAIPLYSRIALLSQVVDVFYANGDRQVSIREAINRSNSWFDPMIVGAFVRVSKNINFWNGLLAPDLERRIFSLEPARKRINVDEDYLDDIAKAFGQIVDAKSPYTSGHSVRVAQYADMMGEYLGMTIAERRILRRGALLHDVGKLGVSNAILDKPGPLDEDEWKLMRDHAIHSETILSRIGALRDMGVKAAAHHERLDGKGYPRGLKEEQISLETRIITIADFFDALIADRPYRAAIPIEKALAIIEEEIGYGVDAQCFAALQAVIGPLETFYERFDINNETHSAAGAA